MVGCQEGFPRFDRLMDRLMGRLMDSYSMAERCGPTVAVNMHDCEMKIFSPFSQMNFT